MSFTDQRQRIATEKDCKAKWGNGKPGEFFRCYLCGHKFAVGDKWRWVAAGKVRLMNLLVCESCDGNDVLDRWLAMHKEAKDRFWWFTREFFLGGE